METIKTKTKAADQSVTMSQLEQVLERFGEKLEDRLEKKMDVRFDHFDKRLTETEACINKKIDFEISELGKSISSLAQVMHERFEITDRRIDLLAVSMNKLEARFDFFTET